MNANLQKKVNRFPISPGVYRFLDAKGGVLYVGKAKNLKSRIKSYFLKEIGRGPGIDIMVSLASNIDFIETESEIEAILLEAEIIYKLKPKYNSRSKDDKSFLVIKITKPALCHPPIWSGAGSRAGNAMTSFESEPEGSSLRVEDRGSNIVKTNCIDSGSPHFAEATRGRQVAVRNDILMFPCVELVRQKNVDFSDKSAQYFGPYPAGLLLKKSINYLRKIFPFRDCSKTKYATYRKKGRPCIYGDIRVCTAPCVDWVNARQYLKSISYLKKFLRGQKDQIYKELEKEMKVLSKAKRYEEASLVRDQLNALNHLKEVSVGLRDDVFDATGTIFHRIECYDISNIGDEYVVGSMAVFTDGKPDKSEYRKFKIRYQNTDNRYQPKEETRLTKPHRCGGVNQCHKSNSDLSRLNEMLERRFMNNWPLPDLVAIDGGEMQLRVASEVLKKNNLTIPAVSIAKGPKRDKNEFYYSDQSIAKYFFGNINLKNVVISARGEAHRFAIAYYRELHKKGMFK